MLGSYRRTKIVGTVGPAVSSKEWLEKLIVEGVDVVRLNFSHGNHNEFSRIISDIREIEKVVGRPIGIMADIQGPKLRIGRLENGEIELKVGSQVIITSENITGSIDPKTGIALVPTSYKEFNRDVLPGHMILLDDGLMTLKALEKTPKGLLCSVINGGILKQNKGINSPEASFSARAITEKDYADILFCVERGVEFIALSFVRSAQEVRHLKNFITERGKKILVISKIEKREALANLDEIIDASDGILVARGDLAVEVGNERVPVLQKKIVRRCNLRGKSVIIATQMLMSMVDNPRPTRAEASDVANGIVDETDALMLSNETAVGKYPVESVHMMKRIIEEMECEPFPQPILYNEWLLPPEGQLAVALLQSAVRLASIVKARLIVVVTQSGQSALLTSKCRPNNRVLAITGNIETYRQLSMKWGVEGLFMEDMATLMTQTSMFEAIGQRLLAKGLCNTGDKLVITAGLPRAAHGSTNTIKVHQV
ncbi:MAG: pyruvate kinase [Deltaproteobacteria bacterium]|nr:pyruvate kinase [Deltaproteobacteria bacterium]MBM4317542.1 pyruvate kinase [Deltaproteobacteria bacterium]